MWSYRNPVHVVFGRGALARLAELLGGRRYALVTYGERFFAELAGRIAGLAGAPVVTIDEIAPNPDFHSLERLCPRIGVDGAVEVMLAVGGGSVIDAAKVIAAARGDFARIRRHLEQREDIGLPVPLPVVVVPTTAGTGSEVTSWATVWDTDRQQKHSLEQPDLYPECAIIDPELMLGLPRAVTISAGLDALSHALESLWNRQANPVSSNHAVFAAREILDCLPRLAAHGADLALRERMARAALFAGLAFSNTHTALAHSLSYAITLRHAVPHGIACSFSLPLVMRGAMGLDPACDAALARIFDGNLMDGAARLESFLGQLGVSTDPRDHGLGAGDWEALLAAAFAGERGRNYIGNLESLAGENGSLHAASG